MKSEDWTAAQRERLTQLNDRANEIPGVSVLEMATMEAIIATLVDAGVTTIDKILGEIEYRVDRREQLVYKF